MKFVEVTNVTHPLPRPLVARYCSSFGFRLRGLMFHKPLPTDEGLLLVEKRDQVINSAIHMMFVNFDLAVVWINQQGEVVDTVLARRWRPGYIPKRAAQMVLEITASRLAEFKVGDRVSFHEISVGH
ncbi:MAG: DUF192 domain-containing protein [Anaerolineales bacterium]|jgi:uncharacterized membrane protein (UPF0127 family)|nr:DUF192 domain-containing protein [Anaerolineales bacterium]